MAEESYPPELKYHPEHDWARVEGDEATFGITWYAQDSLGEVVVNGDERVGVGRLDGPAQCRVVVAGERRQGQLACACKIPGWARAGEA